MMTVLVMAPDADPWTPVLEGAALRVGAGVRVVDGLEGLPFEVRVDRRGRPRCTVRARAGEEPGGIVFRGGTVLAQDEGFGGSERLAACWALLASFDGPVVNRPTRHGPLLTVDRLRTRRAAGVGTGAWTLREPWTAAPAATVTVVRGAADRRPVARPGRAGCFPALPQALEVVECGSPTVLRLLVAGERVLVPAGDRTRDLPAPAADRLREVLRPDLPALVWLVAGFDPGGGCRVLDVDPLPGTDLLGPVVQDAADAVIGCALRGEPS